MIECTKNVASLASQAFGKQNIFISDLKKMMKEFALDPAVSSTAREAFIVSDADIPARLVKDFTNAAAAKHNDNVIVFISRKGNAQFQDQAGINAVLEKPSAEQLSETVFGIIESVIQRSNSIPPTQATKSDEKVKEESADQWQGSGIWEGIKLDETQAAEDVMSKPEAPQDLQIDLSKPQVEEAPVLFDSPENMLDRIAECQKVADVRILTRELDATNVIKDIIKNSADYAGIEDRLKGINEKIQAVYLDTAIPMKDKLDKVRALLYDKNYYRAKTNTIVEQRVEEIITTITEKTKECLDARCAELDRIILNYTVMTKEPLATARIAGLLDDRANMLLEIAALREEVQAIFAKVDKFASDVIADIAEDSTIRTGSPLIDARLRLSGDTTVPEQTIDTIQHILSVADVKSAEFKEANRKLIVLTQKLQTVMNMDKELISALTQVIEYMHSNNIEDKIIQNTLIKKSLRLYVAMDGTGRTVIPYICSRLKSQENYNVLYIDITGKSRLADYGETSRSLDDWMQERYQEAFCVVTGELSNNEDSMQRFLVALTKAADYYRVINVVMSVEQRVALETLVPDVLCVNYIIDPTTASLEFFAGYIKETQYDNVAQRVIVNKCIPSTTSAIIEKLGLIEDMNVHVTTIPYEPLITECSIRGVKPYCIQAVQEAFKEVCKVC